jgi:hypothetical protein
MLRVSPITLDRRERAASNLHQPGLQYDGIVTNCHHDARRRA